MSSSPSQSASAFASLPLELIERITRKLPTRDITALRQTCSLVEYKMRHCFALDFMSKKQFMISTHSLGALQEIAHDETFRQTLKHLILGTDQFDTSKMSTVDAAVRGELMDCWADQAHLLSTGIWRDKLTDALRCLPNLATIDIRDFNSKTRYRDGADAVFRSLGSGRLADKFGDRDADRNGALTTLTASHNNMTQIPDILFQNTILAMAESGTKCTSVEMIGRRCGLQQSAFAVTPTTLPVIQRLTKLHIVLDTRQASWTGFRPLMLFLAAATNLKNLRINLYGGGALSHDHSQGNVEAWIAGRSKAGDGAIPSPTFELENLELGMYDAVDHETLNALFERFSGTLKTAVLWKTSISREPTGPMDTTQYNLWADFITARKAAAANGAVLQTLDIGGGIGLSQRIGYVNSPVYFLRQNIMKYTIDTRKGPAVWDLALKHLVVQQPPSYSDEDDSDMSGSDGDGDEDEDEEDEDGSGGDD